MIEFHSFTRFWNTATFIQYSLLVGNAIVRYCRSVYFLQLKQSSQCLVQMLMKVHHHTSAWTKSYCVNKFLGQSVWKWSFCEFHAYILSNGVSFSKMPIFGFSMANTEKMILIPRLPLTKMSGIHVNTFSGGACATAFSSHFHELWQGLSYQVLYTCLLETRIQWLLDISQLLQCLSFLSISSSSFSSKAFARHPTTAFRFCGETIEVFCILWF